MKTALLVGVALAFSAARAPGGEIFGTITNGARPLAKGVKVEIVVGEKTYGAETDRFGSYRIFVRERGKCTLSVTTNDPPPSAEIFSYDKSTRYDWVLETRDGKLSLRRK